MRHIPTITFLIAYAYIFIAVVNKLISRENPMIQWALHIVVATILAWVAANLAFAVARKTTVICRWLRPKIKRRL